MIQIRQKKQNFHKEARKEHLQNHFRQKRRKFFDFNFSKKEQIDDLFEKSLAKNGILFLIRQGNGLRLLDQQVEKSCLSNELLYKRKVLATFSNSLKDQLKPHQRQILFRMSFKVFLSFELWDVQIINYHEKFKHVMQFVSQEIFTFYISSVLLISKNLDEDDKLNIQKFIYPVFGELIFYGIKSIQNQQSLINFNSDIKICIYNIFQEDQDHNMINSYKAIRNLSFFIRISEKHFDLITLDKDFPPKFLKLQRRLFWLYNKLTQYFSNIIGFFQRNDFLMLILNGFLQKQNQSIYKYVYSILRTLIDKAMFIKQIQNLMYRFDDDSGFYYFDNIFDEIEKDNESSYYALELLEGFLIYCHQRNEFIELIENYKMRYVQMCIKELNRIEKENITTEMGRKRVQKILNMIYEFIEMGNLGKNKKPNEFIVHLQSLGGFRKLEQINYWIEEIDHNEEQSLKHLGEMIDWILIQAVEFKVESDYPDAQLII